jgi:nucleotide-binding universal stress UspA family protein
MDGAGNEVVAPAPPAAETARTSGQYAAPVATGDVVDGFLVEERLHQGGMASLWRVTHPDHPLPMLMKVPRTHSGEEPSAIVGFEVEMMILPRLSGPHVPRFIARGDYTRRPYIVMEQIPGPTLRERLDAAPLPIDEVARLGARIATALHDLHRQHVVHLDVKPSNILMRDSGEAVLVDFGLSHHDQLPDLLDEEFVLPLGTAPYMSPEQVQHQRHEPRSDLFSLGVLLYHFTTGARPFGNPSTLRGLRRRLYTAPVPPRALRPDCPPWLQETILRCLEVHAAERHLTGAQLAFDLLHPESVTLTERAHRIDTPGFLARMRRWLHAAGADPQAPATVQAQVVRSPIVLLALDPGGTGALRDALRESVLRLMQTRPGARLACVSVLKTNYIGMDQLLDEQGRSLHLRRLIELKQWAHELRQSLDAAQDDARVTCHVLEAPDVAAALLDYAQRNQVDHIVMGARGSPSLLRVLGSVSAQVATSAECTVTVVRTPQH